MKITKRQLRRIIRESINEYSSGGGSSTGGHSPDESFYDFAADTAAEAARIANTVDGPKGRAAKKLFTDMMKERVAEERAYGVDSKKMRKIINDTWKQIYRQDGIK